MVDVFRGVRRVLRDDGTLWLNLGDTYSGGKTGRADAERNGVDGFTGGQKGKGVPLPERDTLGIPSGNLVGVPWRVALALQVDGWILRQDVIWSKPSPMPESVRNRCTKAHEHVFLFAKKPGYFYDAEAIKEKAKPESYARYEFGFTTQDGKTGDPSNDAAFGCKATKQKDGKERFRDLSGANKRSVWSVDDHRALLDWLAANDPALLMRFLGESRNKTDVWRVSSKGYSGAHFATFPEKLIKPMILAGTAVGDVVLDPFLGSGTTAIASLRHGRRCWGIDLSEEYLTDQAVPRIRDFLRSRLDLEHLVGEEVGTRAAAPSQKAVRIGKGG
jgi:DNA modification methylase